MVKNQCLKIWFLIYPKKFNSLWRQYFYSKTPQNLHVWSQPLSIGHCKIWTRYDWEKKELPTADFVCVRVARRNFIHRGQLIHTLQQKLYALYALLMAQIDSFGCCFNKNKLYKLISSDYMQKCAAYDLPQPGEIVHLNWGKSYAFLHYLIWLSIIIFRIFWWWLAKWKNMNIPKEIDLQ